MSSPVLIGIYKDKKLLKTYDSFDKTSEVLPSVFLEIEKNFKIKSLYYAKGPGSFMSIKISYIFLKTYSIAKHIPFKATDAFYFNKNAPIKAIGKSYFVKVGDNIILDTIQDKEQIGSFSLPKVLKDGDFSDDNAPLYVLPAV